MTKPLITAGQASSGTRQNDELPFPGDTSPGLIAMNSANLLVGIPAELPDELLTTLHRSGGVRIDRIVSRGHCSPPGFWYDQEQNEWILLLEGSAALEFEGGDGPVELRRGSYLNIPAHARHRVVWTDAEERTVWLAIHFD